MKKHIGSYPRVRVEGGGVAAVSQAGAMLLVETVRKSDLDAAISAAFVPCANRGRCTIRARFCWMSRSRSRRGD